MYGDHDEGDLLPSDVSLGHYTHADRHTVSTLYSADAVCNKIGPTCGPWPRVQLIAAFFVGFPHPGSNTTRVLSHDTGINARTRL